LKAIRKHSDGRHEIYGSLVAKHAHEKPSPELLADSPASDSTSPTSAGSESDEFEALSTNVLERSRKHLSRRLGIFGDTTKHVLSLSEVPFPVSVDDAAACDRLPSRRRLLLLKHSLRVQPRRISGLQPLQLPRIVSMRHLAVGDSALGGILQHRFIPSFDYFWAILGYSLILDLFHLFLVTVRICILFLRVHIPVSDCFLLYCYISGSGTQ
jgi:hypothetical protein